MTNRLLGLAGPARQLGVSMRGVSVRLPWIRLSLLLAALIVFASCNNDPEYEQLNLETDCLEVVIAPEGEAGDDDDSAGDDDDSAADEEPGLSIAEIELVARPGVFQDDVTLGTASVTPSAGPAGTRFLLTAVVEDNQAETGNPIEVVDRVTVKVDNGALTVGEFDMEASPGDESRWTLILAAGGPESASREDSLCIAVYAEIE